MTPLLIRFRVPLEAPSVNHYKLPNAGGGWRLSPEAQAFKDAIVIFARETRLGGHAFHWKRYVVTVVYGLAERTRLDIDNGAKLVLDGLQASGLIRNDSDVLELIQQKRRVADARKVFTAVTVSEFVGSEFV